VLQNYPPVSLDLSTLAFTAVLTVVTGLVFGMAPAFAAAGISIQDALKSASRTQSGGRRAARLRQVLIVAELGVSLVLLIGAGLLARSFTKLAKTQLGFPAENLLTMRMNLTGSRYATGASQKHFYEEALERIKQLPMVRQAAVSTDLPLSGEGASSGMYIRVAGRAPVPMAQLPLSEVTVVSRDYFQTLEVPVKSGRVFTSQDNERSSGNIIVNEAFAKKIFPGEDPLGKRILSGPNGEFRQTIVGVVGSIRGGHLGVDPAPLIYRCNCQSQSPFESGMGFLIRTKDDPRPAIRTVEAQIYGVDRGEPVFDVKTMNERLADSLAPQRFHLLLIGIFAVIAIVLAAVGVYGVMSYLVTLRTREFGIRMALGARLEDVLGLVLKESFALAIVAIVAGLGGAWALTRYLKSMLYGVTPLDGWTFITMPVLLAAIAITASFVPALKASRSDPTTALRKE
jgi:putative ABC transport system permease protein